MSGAKSTWHVSWCGTADEAASTGRRGGDALEEAVAPILSSYATASARDPAFWEAFADFHSAVGDPEGAEEALYKRVSTRTTVLLFRHLHVGVQEHLFCLASQWFVWQLIALCCKSIPSCTLYSISAMQFCQPCEDF